MRCIKKICEEKSVETLSIIKLISSEAFVEDEHPRDNDGKFSDKGSNSIVDKTVDDGMSIVKRLNKHGYGAGLSNLYKEAGLKIDKEHTHMFAQPIHSKFELSMHDNNVKYFKEKLKSEPKLMKIWKSYQKQVKNYNKELEKKYNKSDVFKRGTSIDELNSYIKDDCISCDYENEYGNVKKRDYEFLSLSMNEKEVKDLYNFGVISNFEGDSVRNIGKRVNYDSEPTPYPAQNSNLEEGINELESFDKDYDAYFADEQEVRIPRNVKLSDIKIDSIQITGWKIMGYSNLVKFDKQLAKDYVQRVGRDDISSEEFWNESKDRIVKAITNKYAGLTDNIEVNYR